MKMEINTTIKKTFFSKFAKFGLFPALILLLNTGLASAQNCPLGCNNSVQISLDGDCSVEVTPDMVLEGQGDAGCDYSVAILGSNGQPINTPLGPNGGPTVTASYIGQTLTVEISLGANSCWGNITIEDKLKPTITCLPDVTVHCYQSSFLALPNAVDNCDQNVTVTVLSDEMENLDCSDDYSAVRTYVYRAEDNYGNKSELCTRKVYLARVNLEDVEFPRNKDNAQDDALSCDNSPFWDANGDGYPQPSESGVPSTIVGGVNVYPNNALCELNIRFDDEVLPICESSFKVLRKWTILDWCTGNLEEQYQIVKVVDDKGPLVQPVSAVCEYDADVRVNPYSCTAEWDVIAPVTLSDCSSTSFTVAYYHAPNYDTNAEDGFYVNTNVIVNNNTFDDNTYTIKDLPMGRNWIRYTVADACGNTTEFYTAVDIIDNVPPVPVCDEFTVATLTNGGFARIFANTFDDGSHDNCTTPVGFEVRRMTSGCGQSTTAWNDYVDFCCDDIGKEIMVVLRVWDDANGTGKYGDSVSKICDTNGSGILGDVVNGVADEEVILMDNSNTCMVEVSVDDKLDPTIVCPSDVTLDCGSDIEDYSLTGIATADDNCAVVELRKVDEGNLNNCGLGTITRTWIATDAGGRSGLCEQNITIVNNTPFDRDDIKFPVGVTLDGCMNVDTEPSRLGEPEITIRGCSQIAATYEDQVFTFVDDVCFKILRKWTVIDWCQFDANTGAGIWSKTQIIKVNNQNAPTFTSCENKTVEAFGANCNEFVNLNIEATDDCTLAADLSYTYVLDIDNDGTLNISGNSNDASRVLSTGQHKIYWTVKDLCGNETECSQIITVVDKKKPTPYCLSEVTTVIMPSTGMVEIWATDFNLGSTDNCPGELKFSFSSNTNHGSETFECEDIGIQLLQIWVTDASGNQDFCTTQINIQANEECNAPRIAGDINSENNQAVQEVLVSLEHMTTHEVSNYTTDENGHYEFANIVAGADYQVIANKDGDYRNGVNTLDIVKIQRHILGLETLDSPYKLIAADANGDEQIRPSDLLSIRKLVLGISPDFGTNGQSWKFIDTDYNFTDNNDPFPTDDAEVIALNDIQVSEMNNHFMAIKIGDVDMTAEGNLQNGNKVDSRSANTLSMAAVNTVYQAGDQISVPVTVSEVTSIFGMQFTMETTDLTLSSISDGAMELSNNNLAEIDAHTYAVSWNDVKAKSFDANEVLFTLNFTATGSGTLIDALSISSSVTAAEAYDETLQTIGVKLAVKDESIDVSEFKLEQNTPNPFVDQTNVSFFLPTEGKATLKVYSITGQVLSKTTKHYNKGQNEISIIGNDLLSSGVMYYQLEFKGQVSIKKMIMIGK